MNDALDALFAAITPIAIRANLHPRHLRDGGGWGDNEEIAVNLGDVRALARAYNNLKLALDQEKAARCE